MSISINTVKGKISPAGCIICILLAVVLLPVIIVAAAVLFVFTVICRIFGIDTGKRGSWFARYGSVRRGRDVSGCQQGRGDVPASEDVIDVDAVAVPADESTVQQLNGGE